MFELYIPRVGDLVVPHINTTFQFEHCGKQFSHGVVISTVPFVVSSPEGDHAWQGTITPSMFVKFGDATEVQIEKLRHDQAKSA